MQEKEQAKIGKALMKVALGFEVAEVTEEFAEVDGELKLTKRKKTKKEIPPDLRAVQLLLAESGAENDFSKMSDEELQREKLRLIKLLDADGKSEEGTGQVCVESKSTVKKPRAKPRKRVIRKK